ncbi:MAG TPA: hypothetical protein VFB62_14645, partial [Polyangiaceae bacterium]|nr:hypothetical protein [Polyangiaceae bacterium]
TLIAAGRYPVPQRDDEATLVQPIARPGSQPHLESPFSDPRPEYSKTSEFDVEQNSARPSPPPIPPSPSIISHGALSQRLAERELAVQAALAAASGFTEDEMARAARRNRHATTGAMVLLGAGMVLGALYGYLSSHALADGGSAATSASYASLTVLTTIALFFAGTAPLQRSTELKVAMVVMSGLVLLFTLVRMLTIALG